MHGIWRFIPFCVIESIEVKKGYSISPMLICVASTASQFVDSDLCYQVQTEDESITPGISKKLSRNVSSLHKDKSTFVHFLTATSKLQDILIAPQRIFSPCRISKSLSNSSQQFSSRIESRSTCLLYS
jgi:hypothetical protein